MKPWKAQKGRLVSISDLPADGLLYDIGHKTKATRFEDGHWLVYHYLTQIIYFANDHMILDAGGYRSDATRKRMELYCGVYDVHIEPYGKNWIVTYRGDRELFSDGMRVNLTGNNTYDKSGCTEDIGSIKLRDKVIDNLRKAIEETGKMPESKAMLVAQNVRFINPATALESLGHNKIFRDFSLKCHQTLPTMINILKDIENA